MVPMASCASGSAQVAALRHRLVVNALTVVRKLRGLYAIRLHVTCVSMAVAAGRRDIQWIDARPDVTRGPNVVNSMAVRAHCHLRISCIQFLSVNTGVVLHKLVGT